MASIHPPNAVAYTPRTYDFYSKLIRHDPQPVTFTDRRGKYYLEFKSGQIRDMAAGIFSTEWNRVLQYRSPVSDAIPELEKLVHPKTDEETKVSQGLVTKTDINLDQLNDLIFFFREQYSPKFLYRVSSLPKLIEVNQEVFLTIQKIQNIIQSVIETEKYQKLIQEYSSLISQAPEHERWHYGMMIEIEYDPTIQINWLFPVGSSTHTDMSGASPREQYETQLVNFYNRFYQLRKTKYYGHRKCVALSSDYFLENPNQTERQYSQLNVPRQQSHVEQRPYQSLESKTNHKQGQQRAG